MENNSVDVAILLIVTIPFVIGTVGNTAALYILHKSAKKRNAKHVLMLRFLAANDLVSEIGMLVLFYIKPPGLIAWQTKCILYVLLRAFGIGSVCVAFVMAVERWLALTKPFFYQQYITYPVLKWSIFSLWLLAATLTYLPLFGFGLYYNTDNNYTKCARFRDAKLHKDIIYAYVYFVFGTILCCCIAYCNTMVCWALSRIGTQKKILVRRVSRSIMNNRIGKCKQYATAEELAFAKVMAFLCIICIVCWMPQLVLIPLTQLNYTNNAYKMLSKIANILMVVYFTIDPYVYVIQQYMEKSRFKIPFKSRRSTSSTVQPSTPETPTAALLTLPSYSPSNV